jgi:DUF4097 and DUF4098 domain-containing protein YvlB
MQVFETPGSVSLQIRLPSGRVVVTTADEPRTSVDVISTGRRGSDAADSIEITAKERHGGHLVSIEHKDQIRWGPIQISWSSDVEVRVTCPPGSNLDFSGGSADLRVTGDLGEVSAKTASGDLSLNDVVRRLEAKTASGDVTVGTIAEGGQLVTVSGDVHIRAFDRELSARSVSGDVRVERVRAPLHVGTTSGDIGLDSVEGGEVRVQSVSGDARVGVARGTRVWIDATSVSGSLNSELGIEDAPAGEESADSPVVPLQLKSVSGDVRIVRAAPVAAAESA